MPEEVRYTMKEIEAATGIKSSTLSSRRKARKIQPNPDGYTLPEVKTLIKKRRRGGGAFQPQEG